MIRNLKLLGLVLVAVLAMCAMAASVASAQNYHFASTQEHTNLIGTQVGQDVFIVDAGQTRCNTVTYTGTVAGTTALEMTLMPHFTECALNPIGSTVIDMNSCDFVYTAKTKPNLELHITCSKPGDSITKTVAALGSLKCTIHIPPQTLTGVTISAVAGGDLTMVTNISGISYSQTKGSGLGACVTKENTNGQWTGHMTIAGGAASLDLANT